MVVTLITMSSCRLGLIVARIAIFLNFLLIGLVLSEVLFKAHFLVGCILPCFLFLLAVLMHVRIHLFEVIHLFSPKTFIQCVFEIIAGPNIPEFSGGLTFLEGTDLLLAFGMRTIQWRMHFFCTSLGS